jgi:hypothetical protein
MVNAVESDPKASSEVQPAEQSAVDLAMDALMAQANEAIRAAEAKLIRYSVLSQKTSLLDESLQKEALKVGDIPEKVRIFLAARNDLNEALREDWTNSEVLASSLGGALIEKLLGKPVPGLISLPVHGSSRIHQEMVTALCWARRNKQGHPCGYVKTRSSSREFMVIGGQAYFLQEISI